VAYGANDFFVNNAVWHEDVFAVKIFDRCVAQPDFDDGARDVLTDDFDDFTDDERAADADRNTAEDVAERGLRGDADSDGDEAGAGQQGFAELLKRGDCLHNDEDADEDDKHFEQPVEEFDITLVGAHKQPFDELDKCKGGNRDDDGQD
jgi:hypothetical protein